MYIIDTHALLWYLRDSDELSDKAHKIIDNNYLYRKQKYEGNVGTSNLQSSISILPLTFANKHIG